MTPEQYGELHRVLGRLEEGQSGMHRKLDEHIARAEATDASHSKRIGSLEGSRKWATGVIATLSFLLGAFKVFKG